MLKLARFVTRPMKSSSDKAKPDTCDIVIGALYTNQKYLKPNKVYEIREGFCDRPEIVEVGDSWIPYQISDSSNDLQVEHCWGNELGTLVDIYGSKLILTKTEMAFQILSQERRNK